jgi:hypothetical protein
MRGAFADLWAFAAESGTSSIPTLAMMASRLEGNLILISLLEPISERG